MAKTRPRIGIIDIVLVLVLIAAIAGIVHRVDKTLNYQWNWKAIPQFLFFFDAEKGRWMPNILIKGLMTTLRLSVWGTLLALCMGTAAGLLRVSRSLSNRVLGRLYVETVRNLPPIVLVFIFYYFISGQIVAAFPVDEWIAVASPPVQTFLSYVLAPPAQLPAFMAALITLAVFEGAYITEIVRAGIESVEKGQWEAASALGLSRAQAMRCIVLPQAFQRILPILGGQFISTIKDSAIVSVISIQELTFQGMELMAATYLTFEVWITITLMYLVLTLSCSVVITRFEKYLNRRRK